MNSEVHICVVSGRLRWQRAYASAALVRGPSLCQKGSVGTLLGVGIWSCCRGVLGGFPELPLAESDRRCRNCRRTSIWRRTTVLHVKQIAISGLGSGRPTAESSAHRGYGGCMAFECKGERRRLGNASALFQGFRAGGANNERNR